MANDTDGESGDSDSFLREVARVDTAYPAPELITGTKLGPYEIAERLGRGGMGVVYRAVDVRLGREVALKVLPAALSSDERRRRFFREARSAASVNHRHVATLYDVGEAEGRLFFAMELVRGTTLRARLAKTKMSLGEAVRVGREIALGVAQAHEKGIVHRDLKPENVMVAEDGSAKVLDFGLAKLREPASDEAALAQQETETREGVVMGTPGYMAPEQESGRAVDPRTDVYALGLLLHEMVTGARPGLLGSGPAIGDPRLAKIVRKCVAPDPAERWADAREVERALAGWETGLSGGAGRRARLGRLLAATAAALAFVAVGSRLRENRVAPADAGESRALAAATTADASGQTVGLLDSPDPVTSSPQALAQYSHALTDLRDARQYPQVALQKAIDLDPDFSAAHLRLAFSRWQPASARDYAEAVRTRERLGARDRELLQAEEPLEVKNPPDLEEGERRFRALREKRPGDVEVVLRLAWIQTHINPAIAPDTYAAAAALDRSMAAPELGLGKMAFEAGDVDAAAAHFRACLQISPTAGRCMMELGETFGAKGDCNSYFDVMRRAVTLTPDDPFGTTGRLLEAMLTSGRSDDEVRGQLAARATTGVWKYVADQFRADRAVWSGDFPEATAAAASAASFSPIDPPPFLSITLPVVEESGDEDQTSRLLKRALSFQATQPFDPDERYLIPALLAHHTVTSASAAKLVAAWRRGRRVQGLAILAARARLRSAVRHHAVRGTRPARARCGLEPASDLVATAGRAGGRPLALARRPSARRARPPAERRVVVPALPR